MDDNKNEDIKENNDETSNNDEQESDDKATENEEIIEADVTEKIMESKEEIVAEDNIAEDKKAVSEILYETTKQVGHFSLNYFKHIGSFMKDHVGAIQRIFSYSFKTHLGLSVIHAFIMSLIPLVLAIKMQLLVHNLGYGKYFQVWGPFLEMMLAVFILTLVFQWALAFVLTAVEGVVERHKVSLFRSLKAVNIIGVVLNPFIIVSGILLLVPFNSLLGYLVLFVFISGLLFSGVMFIKTLVMSRIVSGDHILSMLVLCFITTLLVIAFISVFWNVGYHLIIKLYGAFFLGAFGY